MNKFKHLLSFDLTSYGAAMSLVNQFVDRENIRDFELSPCGSGAQLILLAQDAVSLQVVRSQAEGLFKSQIADCNLVENFHEQLLEIYLAQNKVKLCANLMVLEGSSLSEGFLLTDKMLKANLSVVEFRMIRGASKNVIITLSDNNISKLTEFNVGTFKKAVIETVQPALKSYWEIL